MTGLKRVNESGMKVYAYIRVSTEMQNYASQKHEINNYCDRHGYTIEKWVTESVSGTVAVEKRSFGRYKFQDHRICGADPPAAPRKNLHFVRNMPGYWK